MLDSINKTIEFVKQIKDNSHVLLVGGELFDKKNSQIVNKLKYIFDLVQQQQLNGNIDLLYINTNLLYDDLSLLDYVLEQAYTFNLLNKIKFTTSYDIDGRFGSTKDQMLFINNFYHVKNKFDLANQNIDIVVNTILTDRACKFIQDNLDLVNYVLNEVCYVNFIPYIAFDSILRPTRKQVLSTLQKIDSVHDGYLKKYIRNFDLKQPKLIYKYNKLTSQLEFASADMNECGHGINFTKYSDEQTCFICDIKEVFGNGI